MAPPGTGIREFVRRFPDADACLDHIFQSRWGDHTVCPSCHRFGTWFRVKGRNAYQHSCRSHISVLNGTIFHRSNLPLNLWFYSLLLAANSSHGVRATFLRKQLGIGLASSNHIASAIRWQMASYDRPKQLGGTGKIVTIDEALLQNVTNGDHSRRTVMVMGIASEGQLICGIVPDRKKETLLSNISKFVRPGSTIVTDCWGGYQSLRNIGWQHVAVNHSQAFHDFKGHTTNQVECYWSILKRTLRLYRQISLENLPALLGEVEFRYNRRRGITSIFDELISKFDHFEDGNTEHTANRYVW